MKISCCAKIPFLLSSGYVCLLPTYAFLSTLYLKIASEKALSCVIGSWVSVQLQAPLSRLRWPFNSAIVLGASAPQLLRAQHPHKLEMSSQDAPLAFKIILEIMHLFFATEGAAENLIISSPLFLVLAVKFV